MRGQVALRAQIPSVQTGALCRRSFLGSLLGSCAIGLTSPAQALTNISEDVRVILRAAVQTADYADTKLALDRLIDPNSANAATRNALDQLTRAAHGLIGNVDDDAHKLAAVRTTIYQAGSWNDNRAFSYDHADPTGTVIRNKLIATYLQTRLGNCVSMPILFLILANRLSVRVTLATAPLHVFVRSIDSAGRVTNLETTSGALPARDVWYRQNLPMTDQAIANGIYMRTLSRTESAALMATTVMEHLMSAQRFDEAIAVGNVILEFAPRDAETLVRQGSAFAHLIDRDFVQRFPTEAQIPASLHARYLSLARSNQDAFERAEALGWRQPAS